MGNPGPAPSRAIPRRRLPITGAGVSARPRVAIVVAAPGVGRAQPRLLPPPAGADHFAHGGARLCGAPHSACLRSAAHQERGRDPNPPIASQPHSVATLAGGFLATTTAHVSDRNRVSLQRQQEPCRRIGERARFWRCAAAWTILGGAWPREILPPPSVPPTSCEHGAPATPAGTTRRARTGGRPIACCSVARSICEVFGGSRTIGRSLRGLKVKISSSTPVRAGGGSRTRAWLRRSRCAPESSSRHRSLTPLPPHRSIGEACGVTPG